MPDMTEQDIVNLALYPVDDVDNPARTAFIHQAKKSLEQNLYCTLPDLILPAALEAMIVEATSLEANANHNNSLRNCYLHQQADSDLPASHPRNLQDRSSTRMVAYDQIPETSPLKTFYHSDAIRKMVAEIIGVDALFNNEDPYQPANYVCYQHGDESSWHFDGDNAFTMTLMIQAAEIGGNFELSPNTRTDEDENYDEVARVLKGDGEHVVSVGRSPGALCIFKGCNSLHRVSKVEGDRLRIMGVFVYESAPGVLGDPKVNATIYGPRTLSA